MKVRTLFKFGKPGRMLWATLTKDGHSITLRWGNRGS